MTSERYLAIIKSLVGGWLASAEMSRANDDDIRAGFSMSGVQDMTRKEYIIALKRLFEAINNAQVIVRFDVLPIEE